MCAETSWQLEAAQGWSLVFPFWCRALQRIVAQCVGFSDAGWKEGGWRWLYVCHPPGYCVSKKVVQACSSWHPQGLLSGLRKCELRHQAPEEGLLQPALTLLGSACAAGQVLVCDMGALMLCVQTRLLLLDSCGRKSQALAFLFEGFPSSSAGIYLSDPICSGI